MNRLKKYIVFCMGLVLFFSSVAPALAREGRRADYTLGPELLTNPSFEDGNFTGWTASGLRVVTSDQGNAYDGSYFAGGQHASPEEGNPWHDYAKQSVNISSAEFGAYLFHGAVRRIPYDGDGGTCGNARARIVDPSGDVRYDTGEISSTTWFVFDETITVDEAGDWVIWFTSYGDGGCGGWSSRGHGDDFSFRAQESDTDPPTLDSTSPVDGASDVLISSDLVLTFSEAVDAESGYITIYKSSDDSVVEALDVTGAQVTGSGSTTITADPSSDLSYSTSYYVQVDGTAFDDGAGNSYAGISDTASWDFTTEPEPDTTPPTLDSTTPADGTSDVLISSDLVLTFSEAVDAESGYITIYKSSDDSVVEALDVTGGQVTGSGSTTITADPSSDLSYSTSYYVQVDGTAFDDAAGNSYPGISDTTTWDFSVVTVPPVVFGNHSVTVSPDIETALSNALNNYRPDQSLENPANMWVVTDVSDTENTDYDYISLAGLLVESTIEPDNWSLDDAVWTGISILRDDGGGSYTGGVEGSATYDNLIDDANVDDPAYQPSGGSGSYSYFFPWVAGTLGYYGVKGVHGAGPSDPAWGGAGWKAVDWVGGTVGYADNVFPNGAYVAQSGKVSYVCRDDVQTWVQIGNFLYGHLVDNSNLRMNQYHSQGSYLGSLVTGSHLTPGTASLCDGPVDAHCGYMCQRSTSYHLHFGFKTSGDFFQIEDWVLNLNTGNFVRGSDTVGPGGYIKAEWAENPEYPDTPTPGPSPTPGGPDPTPYAPDVPSGGGGGSIWDGFIGAAQKSVNTRVEDMSQHEERRIVQLTTSGVRIAVSTVYVLLRSNLDLTITMIVFGLIMILEPVRIIRSVWMGIKDLIPFVG